MDGPHAAPVPQGGGVGAELALRLDAADFGPDGESARLTAA